MFVHVREELQNAVEFVDFRLGETLIRKVKELIVQVLLKHLHKDGYKTSDLIGTAHPFLVWCELVITKNHQAKCTERTSNVGQALSD